MPHKSHRTPLKAFHLDIPLWDSHGCVLTGGTAAQVAKVVSHVWGGPPITEFDEEGPDEHMGGLSLSQEGSIWFLWVRDIKDVASLAHEAFHTTSSVLASRGLQLCVASEEAYAYTLSYLMRRILAQKHWRAVSKGVLR